MSYFVYILKLISNVIFHPGGDAVDYSEILDEKFISSFAMS